MSARFGFIKSECLILFSGDKTTNGTFATPGFPESYPPNTRCTFQFRGRSDQVVWILWNDFFLEDPLPLHRCLHDYVEVIVLDYKDVQHISGRYCGNKKPPDFKTMQRSVDIIFQSSFSKHFQGFSGTYRFLDEADVQPSPSHFPGKADPHGAGCGGYSRDSHGGTIQSPNYPEEYIGDLECNWVIRVRSDKQIFIKVLELELTPSFQCEDAQLEVIDGYAHFMPGEEGSLPLSQRIRFCGESKYYREEGEKSYMSDRNRIQIRYPCNEFYCRGGEYCIDEGKSICAERKRYCIDASLICDGVPNCAEFDNSDEENCYSQEILVSGVSVLILLVLIVLIVVYWQRARSRRQLKELLEVSTKSELQQRPVNPMEPNEPLVISKTSQKMLDTNLSQNDVQEVTKVYDNYELAPTYRTINPKKRLIRQSDDPPYPQTLSRNSGRYYPSKADSKSVVTATVLSGTSIDSKPFQRRKGEDSLLKQEAKSFHSGSDEIWQQRDDYVFSKMLPLQDFSRKGNKIGAVQETSDNRDKYSCRFLAKSATNSSLAAEVPPPAAVSTALYSCRSSTSFAKAVPTKGQYVDTFMCTRPSQVTKSSSSHLVSRASYSSESSSKPGGRITYETLRLSGESKPPSSLLTKPKRKSIRQKVEFSDVITVALSPSDPNDNYSSDPDEEETKSEVLHKRLKPTVV
ncbi:unnamed protein product [Soboliphyme baturini]|uniref:CUB domain-containing protein n=1 Tax=Soboliphyme baturini TaxID=241478 RepID=A0A183IG28_9BILA|nr:unnamed protein product [Soboliphyme baturini]